MLREAIPEQDAVNLQHLRRFAKSDFVPDHLRRPVQSFAGRSNEYGTLEKHSAGVDTGEEGGAQELSNEPVAQPSLYLLVCAASIISSPDLASILATHPLLDSVPEISTQVQTIPVPLLPPTSEAQAHVWSRDYWPTVYKRNNPFGPHPSLVSRAEAEIRPQVDHFMTLAANVAREVDEQAMGEAVGAVIVDRSTGTGPVVLAIAGDARWRSIGPCQQFGQGSGNVIAHAVIRAIGMIARKRLEVAAQNLSSEISPTQPSEPIEESIFLDWPLTPTEKSSYAQIPIAPHGYLCLDLEIYITHEPCVMCAMAINHSRFGKVVFGKRMPRTGGLTSGASSLDAAGVTEEKTGGGPKESEMGLGYGLFWRPELNWKLLGWEWVAENGVGTVIPGDVHA